MKHLQFSARKLGAVFLVLALALLLGSSAEAKHKAHAPPGPDPVSAAPADPILGLWYTEDNVGGVELYTCDTHICGRFHYLRDDDEQNDVSHDTHNPDPEKRSRVLCGMEFMTGFKPKGDGHYTDGTIYSPRHGANFSAEMTLVDPDTLNLHGYMLFSFLGESQTWKRSADMPQCSSVVKPAP